MRQPIVYYLLAFLLLILSGLPRAGAQTAEEQTASDGPTATEILRARSPYTQHEDLTGCCRDAQTLSELARRSPAPVDPARIRHPRGWGYDGRRYGGMWRQPGNGRHALIGAIIGFGLGAAIGAKGNQDPHARVVAPVLAGAAGALLGAAIGASRP
jgi:hypothetical protein